MGLYLPDQKTTYIHIPRTGGTWIALAMETVARTKWLCPYRPKWLAMDHRMLGHFRRLPRTNIVFSVVRHPKGLYESTWRWLRRHREKPVRLRWTWHPYSTVIPLRKRRQTFSEWVELVMENDPMWATRMTEQFVGPPGGEFCDFIGRTETLTDDLIELLIHLGIENPERVRDVPVANSIPWPPIVWDPGTLDKMLRSERLLIDRFYGAKIRDRWYGYLRRKSCSVG